MANTKTQRISFGNDSSSSTIKQQTVKIEREIAQEQVAPLKQLTAQIIKEAKDTRSIAKVNPYTSFFPSFYKREISIARLTFIFWTFITIIIVGGICTILGITISNWKSNHNEANPLWCLFFIPLLAIMIVVWCITATRYLNFRSEAKTVNFKDEKKVTINVVKAYRNLKTAHIDVNWFSFTSYLVFFLAIVVDFACFYFIVNKGSGNFFNSIGSMIVNTHKRDYIPYQIVFWCIIIFTCFIIINHVITIVYSAIRIASIDNYYNTMVVPQNEIDLLKKQHNKRDMIICLCFMAVIGLIIYLIIWFVRRKKTTNVVVKA
ncbi:MAG: hypothetical protein LBG49_03400 [Mycoplasmataceae bacterium]|nr:hypothetical protein [Mycoplasmataceae bacterium]